MGGLWINNQEGPGSGVYPVRHPCSGQLLEEQAEADAQTVAAAVAAAQAALRHRLSVDACYRILPRAAALLQQQRETVARTIAREAGKPIKDVRAEVDRGEQTLISSAIAARSLHGEEVPRRATLGWRATAGNDLAQALRGGGGHYAIYFSLNLVLHKVGPALAGGNAGVLMKPAPATP